MPGEGWGLVEAGHGVLVTVHRDTGTGQRGHGARVRLVTPE